MTDAARVDRGEVLQALSPIAVLEYFAVKGRRSGARFRTKLCPTCGPRSRDSVSIDLATGMWRDHAHGCTGDLLSLLGGLAGVDPRQRFRELLELAASIAGVTPGVHVDATRARDVAAHRAELDQEDAAERRAAALRSASASWSRLSTQSEAGAAYLEARGVGDVRELGLVRFFAAGDVALALKTADGKAINVVRRRIGDGEPKVLGLRACPTLGTFVDAVADIEHQRDVVLVEGMFDALTARLAWPAAVVLGAHGANNLPKIAAAAAKRIKLAHARLLLVPHNDAAGVKAMTAAGRAAMAAGLRLDRELVVVDVGHVKDLNDAWRAGWRPR